MKAKIIKSNISRENMSGGSASQFHKSCITSEPYPTSRKYMHTS